MIGAIRKRIEFLRYDASAYPEKFRKRFYIEAIKSDIRDSFTLCVLDNIKKGRLGLALKGTVEVAKNVIDYILARLFI